MSRLESEPWRSLPRETVALITPEIPGLRDEIVQTIAEEVPEYARPLGGPFGRAIRRGVDEALRQFVDLIEDPDGGRAQSREVYVALGRGEMRGGRSLDALQAAYRVGARVAWRRHARAGLAAGMDAAVLCTLADSIFAYIDELAADSVEGYAAAQSEAAGERDRARRRLLALLLGAEVDAGALEAAASLAAWPVSSTAALLACSAEDLPRIARRLPQDALAAVVDELGCILIADADGPGRPAQIDAACAGAGAGVGPCGALADAAASWRRAKAAYRAIEAGLLPLGCMRAHEHLAELSLLAAREPLEDLARARLAVLDPLSAGARERMTATLAAYLDERGSAPAMARVLGVHPQTVRYRIRQLRELFGAALEDPDARFELQSALRARGAAASRQATVHPFTRAGRRVP